MMVLLMSAYEHVLIIAEIVNLTLKCILYSLIALFRMIFPRELKSVVGEIILITGTGHGIGKELALQFARIGAKIVCVDLNEEANKQTVAQITKEGGTAWSYWCDVSKKDEVREVSNKIRRQVGDVTILINNAGILQCKLLLQHTEEDIERMFRVNVYAQYWTIQEWLPTFMKNRRGHIVGISSLCGIFGTANLVPYCSSKFAVTGLMESLSEEMRYGNQYPNIKLTRVHPFHVKTGILSKPRIRFPNITKIVEIEECASAIVDSVRREEEVLYIPSYNFYFFNFLMSSPRKVQQAIVDFLDIGAYSHEN